MGRHVISKTVETFAVHLKRAQTRSNTKGKGLQASCYHYSLDGCYAKSSNRSPEAELILCIY